MKKNYYEILEISENASQEIVEKAYKTLAMKYHPDLHGNSTCDENYEEKLKLINEAYEVLKDKEKRAEYDEELARIRIEESTKAQQNSWINENQANNHAISEDRKDEPLNALNQENQWQDELIQEELRQKALRQEQAINQAYQKAYNDAYIQELKRRGFKIRYKKTPKDYLRIVITFIILILLAVFLWQIPFIHNYFIDLYENNSIVHILLSPFFG